MTCDLGDWTVIGLLCSTWIAATAYMFIHPGDMVFSAWCGLFATMTGVFHFLHVRDSKVPDAVDH